MFFQSTDNNHLKELVKQGAILLDVRNRDEYAESHAASSINIPLNELPSRISELNKDAEIITVCQSGMRSQQAQHLLKTNGFNKLHDGVSWIMFL